MYKNSLLLLFSLLLVSCASPEPQKRQANEKAFEAEDTYILYALYAEKSKEHSAASSLFNTLYEKSEKKEYLYRSLENDLLAKNSEQLITRIDAMPEEFQDDVKLIRLKVVGLFELNRLAQAQKLSIALAKKTQEPNDYILVSDVLIKSQQYDLALRYLDSAYAKEYNEKILDKMSIILYVNLNRQKDAIAYLETHSRMHGSSKLITARLIGFYSDQNNIDGLLSTYKKLYAIDKDQEVAKKIIQIYTYKRDHLHLMDFLEKSRSDDKLLLQLYSSSLNYQKAYSLASELYEKTSNITYLGQSAIYEYESAKNKASQSLLKSVVGKLEKVAQTDKSPMYLNYLGYLLIDHKINVKKGMKYIKSVLKLEPESAYYLDSLAWGYYRLGECEKAKSIIDRVLQLEGGDNIEVIEHSKKINKCIKIKKGKK
jgi:predicted Zn-dependent protease